MCLLFFFFTFLSWWLKVSYQNMFSFLVLFGWRRGNWLLAYFIGDWPSLGIFFLRNPPGFNRKEVMLFMLTLLSTLKYVSRVLKIHVGHILSGRYDKLLLGHILLGRVLKIHVGHILLGRYDKILLGTFYCPRYSYPRTSFPLGFLYILESYV